MLRGGFWYIWLLPISDNLTWIERQGWGSSGYSVVRWSRLIGVRCRNQVSCLAWLGAAHDCGLLRASFWIILQLSLPSHSCPNNPFPWKPVPAAGEELGLGCDRDGQWVVEGKPSGVWASVGTGPGSSSARALGGEPHNFLLEAAWVEAEPDCRVQGQALGTQRL